MRPVFVGLVCRRQRAGGTELQTKNGVANLAVKGAGIQGEKLQSLTVSMYYLSQ